MSPSPTTAAVPSDDVLAGLLRREPGTAALADGGAFGAGFLAQVDFHGIPALLDDGAPPLADAPEEFRARLHERVVAAAVWELRHRHVVGAVLAALDEAGIEALVFKGTALAYSHYDDPSTRLRGDTDLLVPRHRRDDARAVLAAAGMAPDVAVTGEVIAYQLSYGLAVPEGGDHVIDLHWRLNNGELLAGLFSFEELRARAVPLPGLSAQAWAPEPVDAMLIACMHRAVHRVAPYYVDGEVHHSADRLIWLHDIHLLAAGFDEADWARLVARAGDKGLAAVTLDGLRMAMRRFHTGVPDPVLAALGAPGDGEAVTRYLAAGRARRMAMDIAALPGIQMRMRYVRELLLPPRSYMLARYPDADRRPLALLYLRRAAGGLFRGLFAGS